MAALNTKIKMAAFKMAGRIEMPAISIATTNGDALALPGALIAPASLGLLYGTTIPMRKMEKM